jgi:ribonuclease VapC
MMVETSAICAILLAESEWQVLADSIEAGTEAFTTPVCVFEAAMVISARQQRAPSEALALIDDFLAEAGIAVRDVTRPMIPLAVDAWSRYGKRRHAADLNFGDCLSYAAARHHGVKLLFRGADFAATDINRRFGPETLT